MLIITPPPGLHPSTMTPGKPHTHLDRCRLCHTLPRPLHLPDPQLTPGQYNDPESYWDAAQTLGQIYREPRRVTPRLQKEVFRRYAIGYDRRMEFDIDHLVPLCLGGTNSPLNLWPHPWWCLWSPRLKHRLEMRLRQLVVRRAIPLRQAQDALMGDWTRAYRTFLGEPSWSPNRARVASAPKL